MNPLLGVDVSVYQGAKGLPVGMVTKLKAKGIDFVIARASVGVANDTAFVTTIHRCMDAGLDVGAYHFLTDGPAGQRQADVFAQQVRRVGKTPDGILLVCDFEASASNHPSWQQAKDWAKRMAVNVGPDRQLGIYSSRSNAGRVHNPDATGLFDYLWNAYWNNREDLDNHEQSLPSSPPRPGYFGFKEARLWQYGPCKVKAPRTGRQLSYDGDAFYGSIADLRRMGGKRTVPLVERPDYAVGHNTAVATIIAAVTSMTPPAGNNTTLAGWEDGKADTLAALPDLYMEKP